MFIKYAPLPLIRLAAGNASAMWRNIEDKLDGGDMAAAIPLMERVETTLGSADVHALRVLIRCVREVLLETHQATPAVVRALAIVRQDLARLQASDIHSTLHLFPVAQMLHQDAGKKEAERGDFFLPCLPSAGFAGDDSEYKKACLQYAQVYHEQLHTYASKPNQDTLHALRGTLMSIDNRSSQCMGGWMVSMLMALIDGAVDTTGRMSRDDCYFFVRASALLRHAAGGKSEVDNSVLSRLAFRITELDCSRAKALTEKYGLMALHESVQSTALPNAAQFGKAWQDLVDAWEAFLKNTGTLTAAGVLKAIAALETACSINGDLSLMVQEARRFFRAVYASKIQGDRQELLAYLSEHIARINDVCMSADVELIKTHAQESAWIVSEAISKGVMPERARPGESTTSVLPLREILLEVGVEFESALTAVKAGDATGAKQRFDAAINSMQLLSMVAPQIEPYRLFAVDLAEAIGRVELETLGLCLHDLRQAMEVVTRQEDAAQSLLDSAVLRLKIAVEPPVDAVPTDIIQDPEIFEIFDEEASMVCDRLDGMAQKSQEQGGISPESAAEIRNSFHAIKGAARMAGLDLLGEGLWLAEQASVTALAAGHMPMHFIDASRAIASLVRGALIQFRAESKAAIDVRAFEQALQPAGPAQAEQVMSMVVVDEVPQPVAHEEQSDSVVDLSVALGVVNEAAAEEVLSHDPEVLAAFARESREMVSIARTQLTALPSVGVTSELIRAAHSLAGMARIVEMPALEKLARGLENWATAAFGSDKPPGRESVHAALHVFREIDRIIESSGRDAVYLANLGLADELSKYGFDEDGAESSVLAVRHEDGALAEAIVEDVCVGDVSSQPEPRPDVPKDIHVRWDGVERRRQPRPAGTGHHAGFDVPPEVTDDIDREMLAEYLPEAEEKLTALDEQLANFDPAIGNFAEINRLLHTLKGGARLGGMIRLGAMIHQMESVTTAAHGLSEDDARRLVHRVQRAVDSIRRQLQTGGDEAQADVDVQNQTLVSSSQHEAAIVRVSVDKLETVSELISQMRIGQDAARRKLIVGFKSNDDLADPIMRLMDFSRRIAMDAESRMESGARGSSDFDALEFDRFTQLHEHTRRLQEAAMDVRELAQQMGDVLGDLREVVRQQEEVSELAIARMNAMERSNLMVFESRFRSLVRQAAEASGKSCQFEILGNASIERETLEQLLPVMEHILRNGVAHGIEYADTRRSIGKMAAGILRVTSKQDGVYVVIEITDDGAGIQESKILKKGIDLGILRPDTQYTSEEIVDVLFAPGFTTVSEVTDLAGRGVGLDVVRNTVGRIGGSVSVSTKVGMGSVFSIRVPTSMSKLSGLLVRVGGHPYLIASSDLDGIEMVSGQQLRVAYQDGIDVSLEDGRMVQLAPLARLLSIASPPVIRSWNPVVMARGKSHVALHVDTLEFVNNTPIRRASATMPGLSQIQSYAVLSDGGVAPVLSLGKLLSGAALSLSRKRDAADVLKLAPLIMVVDDSVTVRTVSKRMLVKNGYRVIEAFDGADAIERMNSGAELPTVILMDIEMPRMDGFEALQYIKMHANLKHIPAAIISSRNAEKHISHAMRLGASRFFGKPFNNDELLQWIREELALSLH